MKYLRKGLNVMFCFLVGMIVLSGINTANANQITEKVFLECPVIDQAVNENVLELQFASHSITEQNFLVKELLVINALKITSLKNKNLPQFLYNGEIAILKHLQLLKNKKRGKLTFKSFDIGKQYDFKIPDRRIRAVIT